LGAQPQTSKILVLMELKFSGERCARNKERKERGGKEGK
jgi:hypothetical protein